MCNNPSCITQVYLNLCTLFVFLVLVQYCCLSITTISRPPPAGVTASQANKKNTNETTTNWLSKTLTGEDGYSTSNFISNLLYCRNSKAYSVNSPNANDERLVHPFDKKARVLFPILYLVMNLCYFLSSHLNSDYIDAKDNLADHMNGNMYGKYSLEIPWGINILLWWNKWYISGIICKFASVFIQ